MNHPSRVARNNRLVIVISDNQKIEFHAVSLSVDSFVPEDLGKWEINWKYIFKFLFKKNFTQSVVFKLSKQLQQIQLLLQQQLFNYQLTQALYQRNQKKPLVSINSGISPH